MKGTFNAQEGMYISDIVEEVDKVSLYFKIQTQKNR